MLYEIKIRLDDEAGNVSIELDFGDETRVLVVPAPRGRLLLDQISRTCLLEWIVDQDMFDRVRAKDMARGAAE